MIHRVRVQVRDNRLVGHLVKKASVWSKHNCTKWGRYHLAEEWHSGLLNAICSVESLLTAVHGPSPVAAHFE